MRSPLEIITGEFDHALFTTFTLNLPFFERWMLPLLGDARVRNVVVFADEGQLGTSLMDPHVQLAGRLYHVHGVHAPGAFHSKLILLTSPNQARLCVSSANLTVSGQLRNTESAAAFDSSIPGHGGVIAGAAEYFRHLAVGAPPHIAEAILAALGVVEVDDTSGIARFVHNLDAPIIDQIPKGPITASTPFADTTAAARLGAALLFLADGERFTASEGFFAGPWSIEARRFDRTLHGKAYWNPNGEWALIGSPNLTHPGLLQRSNEGNYETAVEFRDLSDSFPEPPSAPWDGDRIESTAPRRAATTNLEPSQTEAKPVSFSAWEDKESIVVAGILDGTPVEFATSTSWSDLGTVRSGIVSIPDGLRPHLLRARIGPRLALAVVHRVAELRVRRSHRPHTSTTRTLSGTLPLDPEGERTLERVLGDLFALAALVSEERARAPRIPHTKRASSEGEKHLTEWLPASPDDEPRIPDLYHRAWAERHPSDVLLALARTALRLDDTIQEDISNEFSASDELRGIDDLDADYEPDEEPAATEESAPETTRAVLERYRQAFLKRLGELAGFTETTESQDLADLAFQIALIQHERLTLEVQIDGELFPLVEPETLLHQKLDLLSAYLNRNSDDPMSMETARYHLAACLRNREVWAPRQWEQLENLTYAHGRRILTTPLPPLPVDNLLGMDLDSAGGWIEGLAARTDWTAVTVHAADYLTDAQLHADPFPHITGSADFTKVSHAPGREGSPAWDTIGFGAIAGLSDDNPYGTAVWNSGVDGAFTAHVLIAAPAELRLYEAMQRRSDQTWLWRYYTPVGRQLLEEAAKLGPTVLKDTYRESITETNVAGLPQPLAAAAENLVATVTGVSL